MTGRVHIVGAGLAGLSAAVRLVEAGRDVSIWEATAQVGGRCRTFWDPRLERFVDNGNHLVLSGNRSARAYMDVIGAADRMEIAPSATFDFVDLRDRARWQVAMNDGPIPCWVFNPRRRIPGTSARDYLTGIALFKAGQQVTVAEAIRSRGAIWGRFWEPLTMAVLNTTPERGAAVPLWRAMAETFARGGGRCRPMLAPDGLGRALVEPGVEWLMKRGVAIGFDHALKSVVIEGGRAQALTFANEQRIDLASDDQVVLALPPTRLKAVLPVIDVPDDSAAILNAHFTISDPAILNNCPRILGVIGGQTHWIFHRGDVISLTISAADQLGVMEKAPDVLIPELWAEVALAMDLGDSDYVAARINKERRATFDQSPSGIAKRPGARTPITNMVLAGDWTETGLPATIEGAVRSGETAARILVLND